MIMFSAGGLEYSEVNSVDITEVRKFYNLDPEMLQKNLNRSVQSPERGTTNYSY